MIAPRAVRFSAQDHAVWRAILHQHAQQRGQQICDLFLNGIGILDIREDTIPDLATINETLRARSGFEGVYVEGLEGPQSFFQLLADRQFPVGAFIRDMGDLSYTPAPDVVHDLYGHLPFYTDKNYADYCQRFGAAAVAYADRADLLRQFERFFWFTIEFGLMKTSAGLRIFGAGIASSTGECEYALSEKPQIVPFDVDAIRHQEFRFDVMQPKLFYLDSPDQLYESLETLTRRVRADA